MATRRDQLQSYQYMNQRVISAFVMRETDPQQSPLRRGIGAIFGGFMIVVVVGAVVGIYGLLTKLGSTAWKADGAVVVEKETGASFVYFSGGLHPTLNYASAKLASGKPNPTVYRVAGKSLRSVPRRVMIGIPGAPNSLPDAKSRVGFPWTLCTTTQVDSSEKAVTLVALAISRAPAGGRRLGEQEGLLIKDAGASTTYLIANGHRYPLGKPETVVPALFGAVTTVIPGGTAWLNALPAGVEISPIQVEGNGTASPAVPGKKVGDLLVAETGSGPQHYLVLDDGLTAITPLQKALLGARSSAQPARISVSEATSAPKSRRMSQLSDETAPPQSPPKLVTPGGGEPLCAETHDAATTPAILVGGSIAGLASANPTGSANGTGTSLADRVYLPPGRVAIVRTLSTPNAPSGSYNVVTDQGIRYPVSSVTALAMLGYSPKQAIDVPASLVNKIPAGPTLDPSMVTQPAVTAGKSTPPAQASPAQTPAAR